MNSFSEVISNSLENKVKDLFSAFIKPDSIQGLSIAVIKEHESATVCLGHSDSETQTKLDPNHYFELASITKTVVGILYSKMILEKKITLETKCVYFWPELKNREVGHVTIVELLTHSSGIPRLPSNLRPQNPMNPYWDYTYNDLMQELRQLNIGSKKYLYSNLGFALLGKIIEIIYKDKVPNVLRREVFLPLGISGIYFSNESEHIKLTTAYSHKLEKVEHWVLGEFEAAGGMRATIEQMKQYLKANIFPDKTQLRDAILDSHKFLYMDGENKVGMAWHNGIKFGNIVHDGGTYGSSSFMEFNPKMKTGIVILSNTYSEFKELFPAIDLCLDL